MTWNIHHLFFIFTLLYFNYIYLQLLLTLHSSITNICLLFLHNMHILASNAMCKAIMNRDAFDINVEFDDNKSFIFISFFFPIYLIINCYKMRYFSSKMNKYSPIYFLTFFIIVLTKKFWNINDWRIKTASMNSAISFTYKYIKKFIHFFSFFFITFSSSFHYTYTLSLNLRIEPCQSTHLNWNVIFLFLISSFQYGQKHVGY